AAGGNGIEQAFLLEPHQGHPDWRTRDAEPLDQRQLGDPVAWLQLAGQNEVAQLQQRPHRLRGRAIPTLQHQRFHPVPVLAFSCSADRLGYILYTEMKESTAEADGSEGAMLRWGQVPSPGGKNNGHVRPHAPRSARWHDCRAIRPPRPRTS